MLPSFARTLSMARRTSLGAGLAWALAACAAAPAEEAVAERPNVVLIFMDDVGYGDLGCYGSITNETPVLDALAEEGMRFTSFYSASGICTPSRAALLTGSYPPRVGVTRVYFPNDRTGLHPDEITVAEILRDAGYATACIGKWHLGHHPDFLPTRQGFDSYFGIPYSNDMDKVEGADRGLDRTWRERDVTPWNVPLLRDEQVVERPADQLTITERYTDEAVAFLRDAGERPFFLYVAHTMPHIPLFVAEEFHVDDPTAAYRATMAELDASVGRILRALDEEDLAEDTLVLFTSDNGPWLSMRHHGGSRGPLRGGKFSTWEGGMRVPCILRWPGQIPPGTTAHQVAATIDLLPTLAALAGAGVPTDRVVDGVDLSALLRGDAAPHLEDRPYYYFREDQLEAVRRGRFKLRRTAPESPPALYDLSWDVAEDHDLAKRRPAVARELQQLLETFEVALEATRRPEGRLADPPEPEEP